MPVKILAFDLDYTLIDSKKRIPPENIEALRYAASKGVYIVPATGRIYIGIPEELRTLPFMRWYLTANGSYIYDAVEDRAAARADIPLDQALDFYAWADTMGLLYDCYRDNWGYMSADMREAVLATITDAGVKKLIETLRTPVPELKTYLREKGTGVQKLQLYFSDMDLRARLLEELPERFPHLAFSSSMPFNIEINALNATNGLRAADPVRPPGHCSRGLHGPRRRDQRSGHDPGRRYRRRHGKRRCLGAGGGGLCDGQLRRFGLCKRRV